MSAVVAERELGCDGQSAHIRVYAPEPDQADWRCEYEISWPQSARRSYAMGVDSYQALQLAMRKIATDVEVSDEFRNGRLEVFGEPLASVADLNQLFLLPSYS